MNTSLMCVFIALYIQIEYEGLGWGFAILRGVLILIVFFTLNYFYQTYFAPRNALSADRCVNVHVCVCVCMRVDIHTHLIVIQWCV
jgi:hypothetical protein